MLIVWIENFPEKEASLLDIIRIKQGISALILRKETIIKVNKAMRSNICFLVTKFEKCQHQ